MLFFFCTLFPLLKNFPGNGKKKKQQKEMKRSYRHSMKGNSQKICGHGLKTFCRNLRNCLILSCNALPKSCRIIFLLSRHSPQKQTLFPIPVKKKSLPCWDYPGMKRKIHPRKCLTPEQNKTANAGSITKTKAEKFLLERKNMAENGAAERL